MHRIVHPIDMLIVDIVIMQKTMKETFYSTKTFLNKEDSPSTGNVCCFDGMTTYDDKKFRNIFISIADCRKAAILHKTDDDTVEDFIEKLEKLNNEILKFIKHLKENGHKEEAAVSTSTTLKT